MAAHHSATSELSGSVMSSGGMSSRDAADPFAKEATLDDIDYVRRTVGDEVEEDPFAMGDETDPLSSSPSVHRHHADQPTYSQQQQQQRPDGDGTGGDGGEDMSDPFAAEIDQSSPESSPTHSQQPKSESPHSVPPLLLRKKDVAAEPATKTSSNRTGGGPTILFKPTEGECGGLMTNGSKTRETGDTNQAMHAVIREANVDMIMSSVPNGGAVVFGQKRSGGKTSTLTTPRTNQFGDGAIDDDDQPAIQYTPGRSGKKKTATTAAARGPPKGDQGQPVDLDDFDF